MTSSEEPYMGDESMTPPPASKNALSTSIRPSRRSLAWPTLKVIHDPMPITGRRSPVDGMALSSRVPANAGRLPNFASRPKAARAARNVRRFSLALPGIAC
jgi:hypothetical protein